MENSNLTRREFLSTSSAVVGAATGLVIPEIVAAGNPAKADTSKILNYNSDMEYRRCGKTGLMISPLPWADTGNV